MLGSHSSGAVYFGIAQESLHSSALEVTLFSWVERCILKGDLESHALAPLLYLF